jgi:hypothetical protein
VEGYCWTCGWHTSQLEGPAGLDPVSKMCGWCRGRWAQAYQGRPRDVTENGRTRDH